MHAYQLLWMAFTIKLRGRQDLTSKLFVPSLPGLAMMLCTIGR